MTPLEQQIKQTLQNRSPREALLNAVTRGRAARLQTWASYPAAMISVLK